MENEIKNYLAVLEAVHTDGMKTGIKLATLSIGLGLVAGNMIARSVVRRIDVKRMQRDRAECVDCVSEIAGDSNESKSV